MSNYPLKKSLPECTHSFLWRISGLLIYWFRKHLYLCERAQKSFVVIRVRPMFYFFALVSMNMFVCLICEHVCAPIYRLCGISRRTAFTHTRFIILGGNSRSRTHKRHLQLELYSPQPRNARHSIRYTRTHTHTIGCVVGPAKDTAYGTAPRPQSLHVRVLAFGLRCRRRLRRSGVRSFVCQRHERARNTRRRSAHRQLKRSQSDACVVCCECARSNDWAKINKPPHNLRHVWAQVAHNYAIIVRVRNILMARGLKSCSFNIESIEWTLYLWAISMHTFKSRLRRRVWSA